MIMISFDEDQELREQARRMMNNEPEPDPIPSQYVPPDLTDVQWVQLFHKYTSISNQNQIDLPTKWMGLKSLGLGEGECEELCRPKEVDVGEVWREVGELSLKQQKELRKYNRENRTLRSDERPVNTEHYQPPTPAS